MNYCTGHQCSIMLGIIVVVLLSFFYRYPAPAFCGGSGFPAEEPAAKRQPFVIEVAGGVARPGVYSFPHTVGAAEVIRAAGGLEEEVSVSSEYMGRVLMNGSLLTIGRDGVSAALTLMDAHKRFLFFVPFAINRANAEELVLVPGIGEKTARAIVSYRDRHGCFPRLEALLEVPGIGPRNFKSMKDFLVL